MDNDISTRRGEVIGRVKVRPGHDEDDAIDGELILGRGQQPQRIIIIGADLLARLLRGIAVSEGRRP